jgi:hypothetical protein
MAVAGTGWQYMSTWVITRQAVFSASSNRAGGHRHNEIGRWDPKSGCGPGDLVGQTHRVAAKAPDGRLKWVRAAADDDVPCLDDEEGRGGAELDRYCVRN